MDDLLSFFKTLSDPNRLRIVALLLEAGEMCVCDIERVLDLPQARVSRHLTLLRSARIVRARRSGQWMHYSLTPDGALQKAVYREIRKALPGIPQLASDQRTLHASLTTCGPACNA